MAGWLIERSSNDATKGGMLQFVSMFSVINIKCSMTRCDVRQAYADFLR